MWSRRHDMKSAYWHNPARWEMCRSAEWTLNTLGSSVFEQAAWTGLFSHLMVRWTRCNSRLTCLFNSIFHCHFQFESISIIKRIIYLLLLFFKCFYTVTEGQVSVSDQYRQYQPTTQYRMRKEICGIEHHYTFFPIVSCLICTLGTNWDRATHVWLVILQSWPVWIVLKLIFTNTCTFVF